MLLLFLGCASGSTQDTVGTPPSQSEPVQWRDAQLVCKGTTLLIRGWTNGPGSGATLLAAATPTDELPVEVTLRLDLLSQAPGSGAQTWQKEESFPDPSCSDLRLWELRLFDARGEELDCLTQDGERC